MKFGGSSVASPAAIKRVASIVQSQAERQPVVVVSALGATTDQLSSILKHAKAGESYLAWKSIKDLREYHFSVVEELLGLRQLELVDQQLRTAFRDLHVRVAEICDGERAVTAEETDATLSLGEQLSSSIVSSFLTQLGITNCHLDARKLILTDNSFTNATPKQWQTYARIRRAMAQVSAGKIVVLGGFIGASEHGRTTTLGRGGSDLTATLVGAAINADEIQIWKDVDGILTADPRIKPDALLVKRISYCEASELAKAGAKVLHPETIAPAQRLRIPIVMRNTFNPRAGGSSIQLDGNHASVKSIVCKRGITVMRISPARSGMSVTECSAAIHDLLTAQRQTLEHWGFSDSALYLALDSKALNGELNFSTDAPVEAHLRTEQALITLVGDGLASGTDLAQRIATLLSSCGSLVLPKTAAAISLKISVPESRLRECLELLHAELFAADGTVFAECSTPSFRPRASLPPAHPNRRDIRVRQALSLAALL